MGYLGPDPRKSVLRLGYSWPSSDIPDSRLGLCWPARPSCVTRGPRWPHVAPDGYTESCRPHRPALVFGSVGSKTLSIMILKAWGLRIRLTIALFIISLELLAVWHPSLLCLQAPCSPFPRERQVSRGGLQPWGSTQTWYIFAPDPRSPILRLGYSWLSEDMSTLAWLSAFTSG